MFWWFWAYDNLGLFSSWRSFSKTTLKQYLFITSLASLNVSVHCICYFFVSYWLLVVPNETPPLESSKERLLWQRSSYRALKQTEMSTYRWRKLVAWTWNCSIPSYNTCLLFFSQSNRDPNIHWVDETPGTISVLMLAEVNIKCSLFLVFDWLIWRSMKSFVNSKGGFIRKLWWLTIVFARTFSASMQGEPSRNRW